MKKWRDTYRIPSARLQNYDYTSNGAYFITICTHFHRHYFGTCADGNMQLSTLGAIAQGFWYEIPKHFLSVKLGEFVVMPNHIHGILILESPIKETLQENTSTENNSIIPNSEPMQPLLVKNEFFSKISPQANSVSTVIRSYKSVCKKHISADFPHQQFKWQPRFHEHIIRNQQSYEKIANYILNNPLTWEEDKLYTQPSP